MYQLLYDEDFDDYCIANGGSRTPWIELHSLFPMTKLPWHYDVSTFARFICLVEFDNEYHNYEAFIKDYPEVLI